MLKKRKRCLILLETAMSNFTIPELNFFDLHHITRWGVGEMVASSVYWEGNKNGGREARGMG